MDTHLPPYWRQHLLAVIGGHAGAENLRLLDAWQHAEGGTAKWNPLNTTFSLPGSTDYNTTGVKNFPKPVWGVCATALTLTNGYYPGILGSLQGGKLTAEQIVENNKGEFQIWGTNPQTVLAYLAVST